MNNENLKLSNIVIENYENNRNFYYNLLKKFYIDYTYNELVKSINSNNKKGIENNSYKLCSISASLGFIDLYNYTYKIIEANRKNEQITYLLKDVENEYYRILCIIKKLYEEIQTQ